MSEAFSRFLPDELRLMTEWNETGVPFPDDRCLHELVEEQASSHPRRSAVVFGDEHLTYEELDKKANQLAWCLIEHGVGPDDVVGVHLKRSISLVVALFAILKAGGAYLPLDTEQPAARSRQILGNARAKVCIADDDELRDVAAVVRVDALGRFPEVKPSVAVTPQHLVSVYYTSGSTGTPKGVANPHGGWVNRMTWMQRQHQLQPGETVLHKTTLTFDDSAIEIFWPLSFGGRVALIGPGLHRDPRAVLDAAIASGTCLLQVVPSMLNSILDVVTPEDREALAGLRGTVSSGEALLPGTVQRFADRMPGKLHNTWGATEVSIDSTIHTCGPDDHQDNGAISVGMPIDNNEVYVLDDLMRPAPIGVTGDLYIAGIGLARGYLQDPRRTAQAFLPNVLHPGERMYRTGDQGYRRPDGSVKFAGRNDHQVKIRGMRVELGEIEVVLSQHPGVKEVVTSVQEADSGLKRLLAHVVPVERGAELSPEEVREHARALLPDYMVPSFVLVLPEFPLTANGKIDRSRLPEPDRLRDYTEVPFVAASGDVEESVTKIWCAVLGIDQMGVLDNFFSLGGNSLAVVEVTNLIEARHGVWVSLRDIFTRPTVKDTAAEVRRLLTEAEAGK
jgi:amino acid adenylation domain-containing protein